MAAGGGTCGKTLGEELFVFDDEPLDLAFRGSDVVEGLNVELAEPLDVDRPTVLDRSEVG